MIKTLTIQNLRGIQKLTLDNLGQFNLFIGKNNCGKTTILEGLYIWAGAPVPNSVLSTNTTRNMPLNSESVPQLFNNSMMDTPIRVITDAGTKEERTVEVEGTKEAFPEIFNANMHNAIPMFSVYYKDKTGYAKTIYRENGDYSEHYAHVRKVSYYNANINFYDISKQVSSIIIEKGKDKVIKILQMVDPAIRDFQMINGNSIMFDIGAPKLVSLQVMGDGIMRLLAIISTIKTVENSIMLVDEIDNGLHHTVMDILWKAVFAACREYNVQLFATTHSYECIQSFKDNLADDRNSDASVIRIERNGEIHKAVTMDMGDLQTMFENNWEIR